MVNILPIYDPETDKFVQINQQELPPKPALPARTAAEEQQAQEEYHRRLAAVIRQVAKKS